MGFKRIHTRPTYTSKIFELEFRDYLDDEQQQHDNIAVLQSADAANVIPITNDNNVLLVKQYRFGIEDYTIEIPGGLVEKGEEQLLGVQRELLEETGYQAERWEFLGSVYSNPVFITSEIHHYIAFGAVKTDTQNLDFDEEIDLIEMPVKEVLAKLEDGFFKHPHTVSALNLGRRFLKC